MSRLERFVSHARRAAYPSIDTFLKERTKIESDWPAYADDPTLCKLPRYFWKDAQSSTPHLAVHGAFDTADWKLQGQLWKNAYDARLQHAMSRMNHHTHPVCNEHTGERRPLASCIPK